MNRLRTNRARRGLFFVRRGAAVENLALKDALPVVGGAPVDPIWAADGGVRHFGAVLGERRYKQPLP